MALDQNIALWAGYQSDPTKAFKDGKWINAEDYVNQFGVKNPQPGFGTVNDTQGYFAGPNEYIKYADSGIAPMTLATGSGNPESPAGTTLAPNVAAGAKPMWEGPEESFFAPFMGALKDLGPFAALTGIGGGLNALASGGSFFANSGGVLGDLWKGLSNPATTGSGANLGSGGSGAGGPTFKGSFDVTGGDALVDPNAFGSAAPNDYAWDMDLGALDSAGGGNLMPPAVPESAAQLKEWGLTETSPGNWITPVGATVSAAQIGQAIKAGGTAKQIADYLGVSENAVNMIGKLGAAGLQAFGSNQQSNALTDLAAKYQEFGAPSRARFESSMTPGFDPNSIPGYAGALDTASKGLLARLSATGGNPFGNPGGLIEANKQIVSGTAMPAIGEYQRLNANTGFGSSMNAALGLQTGAIGADNNVLAGIASGLGSITAPDNSLEALLAKLKNSGIQLNTSGSVLT